MCAVDVTEVYSPALFTERSMQLGLGTVAADLETGWNLETTSRRDKCSNELRSARPKVLIASPPCPSFLELQNLNAGSSGLTESQEKESHYSTITSHICAVRECSEQMHRGDQRLRGKNNALKSSWFRKTFSELLDPCVVGTCCRAWLHS